MEDPSYRQLIPKYALTRSISPDSDPSYEIGIAISEDMGVGEEAGEIGPILKTLSSFYTREVATSVDSVVSIIEPAMIVVLGAGVGILLAAVMVPIYSIAQSSGS